MEQNPHPPPDPCALCTEVFHLIASLIDADRTPIGRPARYYTAFRDYTRDYVKERIAELRERTHSPEQSRRITRFLTSITHRK